MKVRIIENQDNDLLSPVDRNGLAIDCAIHGEGAEEIAGFVPTRYELRQLYKFWARQVIENTIQKFLYQSSSREWRIDYLAYGRLGRIGELLGPEQEDFAKLWQAAEADAAAVDGDEWRRFMEAYTAKPDRRLDELFGEVEPPKPATDSSV